MNSNSLSSSLSHRESENFEFFSLCFCVNVCELEFRFSLFLWDFEFPEMRGICRKREEREREKESLECFSWNSFGSFTSNKSLIHFPNNPFALNLHKRITRCVMWGRENDLLTHMLRWVVGDGPIRCQRLVLQRSGVTVGFFLCDCDHSSYY